MILINKRQRAKMERDLAVQISDDLDIPMTAYHMDIVESCSIAITGIPPLWFGEHMR